MNWGGTVFGIGAIAAAVTGVAVHDLAWTGFALVFAILAHAES